MFSAESLPLSRSQITDLLIEAEILPTDQRLQIAGVLFKEHRHMSINQIYDETTFSRATVYNTINLLARKGIIGRVTIDPYCVLYEANAEPHHHIHNVDTGEVIDVDPESVEMVRLPVPPAGTWLSGFDIIFEVKNRT